MVRSSDTLKNWKGEKNANRTYLMCSSAIGDYGSHVQRHLQKKQQECSIAGEKSVCVDRRRNIPWDDTTVIFASAGLGGMYVGTRIDKDGVESLETANLYANVHAHGWSRKIDI